MKNDHVKPSIGEGPGSTCKKVAQKRGGMAGVFSGVRLREKKRSFPHPERKTPKRGGGFQVNKSKNWRGHEKKEGKREKQGGESVTRKGNRHCGPGLCRGGGKFFKGACQKTRKERPQLASKKKGSDNLYGASEEKRKTK